MSKWLNPKMPMSKMTGDRPVMFVNPWPGTTNEH